jgi:hypothetical protein
MTTTDQLIVEPAEKYNALRSTYLTSHGLMDYLKCPKTHHLKTTGAIPFKTSKAYEIGTAAHALILEGNEAFSERYYIVDPMLEPINAKTGKPFGPATKAYTDWLDSVAGDRIVLSPTDGQMIIDMADAVRSHDAACERLEQGTPEGVLRTTLQCSSGYPVKAQVRVDWFNPDWGLIDLKTIADLDQFTEQFEEYQYDLQFAFYQMVAEEVIGRVFPVHAIVVEKKAPYRVGVFSVSQTGIESKRREILEHLDNYAESAAADHWPTRYEGVRVIGGEG